MTSVQIPPIQFAYAGQTRLAYQIFGERPNIVAIPPTAQNIERAWEWPDVRAMFEQFAPFSRFLHFDKRGTGAPDDWRRGYERSAAAGRVTVRSTDRVISGSRS
ncbi:MAG: hypothetical protein ACLFWH_06010 [Actinomycetota bacterium]